MERLIEELNQHFPEVRKRVVGSIVVDETHLSEDQLLARARDFYAEPGRKEVFNANDWSSSRVTLYRLYCDNGNRAGFSGAASKLAESFAGCRASAGKRSGRCRANRLFMMMRRFASPALMCAAGVRPIWKRCRWMLRIAIFGSLRSRPGIRPQIDSTPDPCDRYRFCLGN